MSLFFRYQLNKTRQAVISLGGRWARPRPVIPVTVIGPSGSRARSALLDTAADDTVFPETLAIDLGIDLNNAPLGEASGVGLTIALIRYAEVILRVTDGQEYREWAAWVGFTAAPLKQPLLGFAGFLQFFTATFHGDVEDVELKVNRLYPGT